MTIDDLEELGVVRMTGAEIDDFLATQGRGVLGLPTEDEPYLLPLSYGYDGEDTLYFTYVVGADSRKATLTEHAGSASFLVHAATSPFQWRSVRLSGTIEAVAPEEYDQIRNDLSDAWRPATFEGVESAGVRLHRYTITDRTGVKHTGLPPGLRDPSDRPADASAGDDAP